MRTGWFYSTCDWISCLLLVRKIKKKERKKNLRSPGSPVNETHPWQQLWHGHTSELTWDETNMPMHHLLISSKFFSLPLLHFHCIPLQFSSLPLQKPLFSFGLKKPITRNLAGGWCAAKLLCLTVCCQKEKLCAYVHTASQSCNMDF